MTNRGGSVEQVVSRPTFPLLRVITSTLQNPYNAWLYLRQSIFFFCCWCLRRGETLTRYFGRLENRSNGAQTVRGLSGVGVAESHRQSMFRLPAGGDFFARGTA